MTSTPPSPAVVKKIDLVQNPDLVGNVSSQFKPTTPFKFLQASED